MYHMDCQQVYGHGELRLFIDWSQPFLAMLIKYIVLPNNYRYTVIVDSYTKC